MDVRGQTAPYLKSLSEALRPLSGTCASLRVPFPQWVNGSPVTTESGVTTVSCELALAPALLPALQAILDGHSSLSSAGTQPSQPSLTWVAQFSSLDPASGRFVKPRPFAVRTRNWPLGVQEADVVAQLKDIWPDMPVLRAERFRSPGLGSPWYFADRFIVHLGPEAELPELPFDLSLPVGDGSITIAVEEIDIDTYKAKWDRTVRAAATEAAASGAARNAAAGPPLRSLSRADARLQQLAAEGRLPGASPPAGAAGPLASGPAAPTPTAAAVFPLQLRQLQLQQLQQQTDPSAAPDPSPPPTQPLAAAVVDAPNDGSAPARAAPASNLPPAGDNSGGDGQGAGTSRGNRVPRSSPSAAVASPSSSRTSSRSSSPPPQRQRRGEPDGTAGPQRLWTDVLRLLPPGDDGMQE